MAEQRTRKKVTDIPVIGDVDDWEADVVKTLLEQPAKVPCTFYIDSAGGSVYGALAIITLLRHRQTEAAAVVIGECSSAALLLFAACSRRVVTPYSTLLFHRMRWQSDKRVDSAEAFVWAKHFEEMERDIDDLQVRLFGKAEEQIRKWIEGSHYVTGPQIVAAGLAEMMDMLFVVRCSLFVARKETEWVGRAVGWAKSSRPTGPIHCPRDTEPRREQAMG